MRKHHGIADTDPKVRRRLLRQDHAPRFGIEGALNGSGRPYLAAEVHEPEKHVELLICIRG